MGNLTSRGPRANRPARLPALPAATSADPVLRDWQEQVREWLEVRLGSRGDFYERAVTHRELQDQIAALERSLSTDGTVTIPDEVLAPLRRQLASLNLQLQFAQNQWLTNLDNSSTTIQNFQNQLRDIAVQDVPYFARDMLPTATGGCSALTVVEFGTGQPNFHALLFDPTTDESADFHAMLPLGWAGKKFRILVYWGHGAGATTFDVKWEIQANSTSDDEPLILDFVGGSFVEDAGGTGGNLYIGAVSDPIPIASDKNADGDMVSMRITRRNAGVTNNLDADAALLAVRFVLSDVVFEGTPPATGFTWNPADKHADITLSAGDATATAASAFKSVRALATAHSTGKWYFEVVHDTAGTFVLSGILSAAESLATAPGFSTTSYGIGPVHTYANSGSDTHSIGSVDSGEVSAIAVDFDAGEIWFGVVNLGLLRWVGDSGVDAGFGAGYGDPATGANPRYTWTPIGTSYLPACSPNSTGQISAPAALTYAPPTGFTAWT